jgi:hypothetical protein
MTIWEGMMQATQAAVIEAARILTDDIEGGKTVVFYSPLIGAQDGTNKVFQIPQSRIIGDSVIIYKNQVPLDPSQFTVTDELRGLLQFTAAPLITDEIAVTFSFAFMTDIELDGHLLCGAQECGLEAYYTQFSGIPGTTAPATIPTDIPAGLLNAIEHLGGYHVSEALVMRYATKYDTEAGDQTFSPSTIADKYDKLAERLHKTGLNARDDFFKGRGRQYYPAIGSRGWPLPPYVPSR